jgi:type IV secretion system protein VirB10
MQTEDSPTAPVTPSTDREANGRPIDDIVSVNDRGRRQGGRLGPFLAIGGVALVILIGGLATVNIIKSKLSGPKPGPATATASAAGLSRSFDTDDAPPIPGAASGATSIQNPVSTCPDGSAGNELRGRDGVVVRDAAGRSVRVCANGQVGGAASTQEASAAPIPVREAGTRREASYSPSAGSTRPSGGSDGPMMLNDGKYGPARAMTAPDAPQAVMGGLQQAAQMLPAKTEGLLTAPASGSLEAELTPSATPMVQAARLGDLNMLLPKGRTIDCGMSMRVISALAGQASCVVTQNVYSANGKVLLIERGSEAVGEYRSGVSIGQKRLFVLWNRIITPGGVVINLNSPGADELGSTGLTGKVDNHWFERIGSAFLLSTIQDAIQYEIAEQQAQSGNTTLVLGNTVQAGNTMAQRVLETTINIPPTLYKNQGDRAVIYVARDLDFSNVYKLRAKR